MTKFQTILISTAVLCLLSFTGVADAKPNQFNVKGTVYCDTCRLQFITRVSTMLEGAKVRLVCKNITTGEETLNTATITNKLGMYNITVEGDFEDDVCQIMLVSSPDKNCTEISKDVYAKYAAKISLTSNNGETSNERNANPLGFMRYMPLRECLNVLKEMDLSEGDIAGLQKA